MGNTAKSILFQGRHVNLAVQDGWEFADRVAEVRGIVAMIAITDENELLVVEQFRPPVNAAVLELPAGLVGDDPNQAHESLVDAARRELHEETGYEAATWQHLFRGAPTAGTSSELLDFYLATELKKTGPGGGEGSEQITVHCVPLGELDGWLQSQQAQRSVVIDAKIYLAHHFAKRKTPAPKEPKT